MKNKTLLFLLVSLFSISAFAQGPTTAIWNPSQNPNTTYRWTEAENWALKDGEYPNNVESEIVDIGQGDYPAEGTVIVDDSVNVFNLKIGNGGETEAVLRVVKGGYLNTGKWWSGIGWNSPGRLIVERGGTMTFGEHMWNGWNSEATSIIEGVVNVTAMYGSAFTGQPGMGVTFIRNGGVLNLSQLHPEQSFPNGSYIDISGGTLTFQSTPDDYEGHIENLNMFIDEAYIIAYEENAELTVTYDETTSIIYVTAASVVYQVDLGEVTDMQEGGKVWVMLGDGSDYAEMTDDNGDGIYMASVPASRVGDLEYWFEYQNGATEDDRAVEDMTGTECASGNKRTIAGVPADSVLVLEPFLFNSCEPAEEAVQQATTVWTGAESSAWTLAANWSDGFVPNDNKVVFNVPTAPEAVLSAESTIKQLVMGDGADGGTLKIANGGTLNTTQGWSGIGWSGSSTLIVEEGGTINFAEHAWIGWDGAATFTIDGGTVNVAGMFGTAFEGGSGTATTTVKRGALNLAQLHDTNSIPEGSVLDIVAGHVTIVGDKTAPVTAYIEAGRITGYGGMGTVNIEVRNDSTFLTATPARQATTVWNPAANPNSTGLWSEAENWTDSNVPLDNKVVFNVPDAPEAVLASESTIKKLVMGDGGPGGMLRVTDGGTLTTNDGWSGVAWTHDAKLIVETGGTVNFGEHAWIGWDGNGTLEINGGVVNVAGMYGTAFEGQSGHGYTTINSGELNLTAFDPVKSIPDTSYINIKQGTLTIEGDQTAAVTAYAEAGKIMAYGGSGELVVEFADGTTTVTATAVRGATTVWNPAANPMSTGMWSEALNWTDGLVPDSNKVVTNVPGARELILNTEATVRQFVFGDGGPGGVVRIADGGTLTTTQGWSGMGWTDTSTVIVETGGTINFAEHAWIGWEGNATLIIDGGTVNVAGMYGTAFEGQSGSASVQVKKGLLNLANIHPDNSIPDGSVLNLELGVVKITGDHLEKVNAYVEAGKITAFGGSGTLDISLTEGVTTIFAIPEKGNTTVWSPDTNPGMSSGLWKNYLNWSDRHVPEDNKVVFRNPNAIECILDTVSTIRQFVLGDGNGGGTLRVVNGGVLTTTNGWSGVAWTHPATVVVDTGGVINFGSHAWIGWVGDATVEINGGTINVGGMYGTAFEGQSGSAKMYVNSGELNLTGFHPEKSIPEGSFLDIKEGRVSIPGDHVAVANAYVEAGRITGYGGDGQVFVTWDNDTTYIDAKDWAVSAKELNDRSEARVYPNPTTGRITIENPANDEFSFAIYNITGKLMLRKDNISGPSTDVDLSNMNQGIYLVNIISQETKVMHKIIKN